MAIYGTILCFGDSLTHGARDDYARCYPFELSRILYEKFNQNWACAEEGVNGEIAADILRRSISTFKKYPEAFEVVLLCGMNDSKDWVDTDPKIYRKNVEDIIRMARVYGKVVLLCTIPELRGFGAPDYSQQSQKRIDVYNEVLEAIAEEQGLILIDLRNLPADCYADGVHFTNKGNIEVATRVARGLIQKRTFDMEVTL